MALLDININTNNLVFSINRGNIGIISLLIEKAILNIPQKTFIIKTFNSTTEYCYVF